MHLADAGDEGCKGANNRHEAGQENSLMTMLVIKCAGLVDMLLLNDILLNHMHTEMLAYHIIAGVAQHSRNQKDGHDNFYIHAFGCGSGKGATGEKQRIAR